MYYAFESDSLSRITPFLEAMPEGSQAYVMKLEHGEYLGIIRLFAHSDALDACIPDRYDVLSSEDGKLAAAKFDTKKPESMHNYISVGCLPYLPAMFSLYVNMMGI